MIWVYFENNDSFFASADKLYIEKTVALNTSFIISDLDTFSDKDAIDLLNAFEGIHAFDNYEDMIQKINKIREKILDQKSEMD